MNILCVTCVDDFVRIFMARVSDFRLFKLRIGWFDLVEGSLVRPHQRQRQGYWSRLTD